MIDLIEKLKDNKAHVIFIDLSNEEQQVLWMLKKKGVVQKLNNEMVWIEKPETEGLRNIDIYRIKPDYQPEPKYVDFEIVKHAQGIVQIWWLGVWKELHDFLPYDFNHLHCLPSLPNFAFFWYEDGCKIPSISIESIANRKAEGKKVFARFRI